MAGIARSAGISSHSTSGCVDRASTCPISLHIPARTRARRAHPGEHRVMPTFDPAVPRILAAHGGVISRAELIERGLSSSAIARRVSSGELKPVVPGVYRPATTPLTSELRLRATSLRLGSAAVVAGRSAAWWHGLTRIESNPIVVILPPRRGHSRWRGVQVVRTHLDPADRMTVRGLAVTGRARTVLDCAASTDAEDIRDIALQRGTTIFSLDRALERLGPGRGVVTARRLIDRGRAASHLPNVLPCTRCSE